MKKAIGGERLGSGQKMDVSLHNYERSTHDLSRVFRTSIAPGTLVPFLVEIGLNGDTFDIDLETMVRTMPTNGALFGSFKLQLDVFQVPIRLYQAMLHMNMNGVGMRMKDVYFPTMGLYNKDGEPFNQSSLMAYLGIRGGNTFKVPTTAPSFAIKNALPLLSYWSIYKQYYANKMEEIGAYIVPNVGRTFSSGYVEIKWKDGGQTTFPLNVNGEVVAGSVILEQGGKVWEKMTFLSNNGTIPTDAVIESFYFDGINNIDTTNKAFEIGKAYNVGNDLVIENEKLEADWLNTYLTGIREETSNEVDPSVIKISTFELSNIDDMHLKILQKDPSSPFLVDKNNCGAPYNECIGYKSVNNTIYVNNEFSQNGLGLKCYQSDLFNNWLSTEWIDGANGISAVTAIDTSDGKFTLDTLNLAKKVYDMLNRVAVSGGSYEDWQEAVYGEEVMRRAESPIYCGGLSREIIFDEVVSSVDASTEDGYFPLGSLAGKGTQSQKKKGGSVYIKVNEPSIIMGIASITPRLDYSQGNKWFTRLNTMDDLHKPALDGIGFQELITEQLCHWDSIYDNSNDTITDKSAGKQPAWLNYMTAYNECYGDFADPNKLMFMTLQRRYEKDVETKGIKDLTTYIDPMKFNYAFANTKLDAQNFWLQIGSDITARRKISAKMIPNL